MSQAPLVLGQAARLLAAATLTVFSTNAQFDPTAADRRDAHPTTVRRALAFIESNPHQDMTAVDIFRAAHVTSGTPQLAFRRHLDSTPMAYLRPVRLDRAHSDLLAAHPAEETGPGIAARSEYAQPG